MKEAAGATAEQEKVSKIVNGEHVLMRRKAAALA